MRSKIDYHSQKSFDPVFATSRVIDTYALQDRSRYCER